LRITRFLSLTDSQYAGCVSAFLDSLAGELNAATMYLRKLEGKAKGSAFAYEMSLDGHRYGALIVLDRWSAVVAAFKANFPAEGIRGAEELIGRANQVLDAAESYSIEVVEGCALAYQSALSAFSTERAAADRYAQLGPMLPEDYRQARQIFLEDLAVR
jgi:hypothetical protein